MIQLRPDIQKVITTTPVKDIRDYLLQNYNVLEIAESLAELLQDQISLKPIVLTEEQFRTHFRIQGYKQNGEKENRGKK